MAGEIKRASRFGLFPVDVTIWKGLHFSLPCLQGSVDATSLARFGFTRKFVVIAGLLSLEHPDHAKLLLQSLGRSA